MWKCTFTWSDRYDELGIPCIIDSYSQQLKLDSLVVIDVGCSSGVALNDCRQLLEARGVTLYTVGIDQSLKVRKDAEKNLNRFILSNVLSVKNCGGVADVVICANMLRYNVTFEEKSLIVGKCARFLKPTGILILASPFPSHFGRHPKKSELCLFDPTPWRKFMRFVLTRLPSNLLQEVLILRKT